MRPTGKTVHEAAMKKVVTVSGGHGTLDNLEVRALNVHSVHPSTTVAHGFGAEPQIFAVKENPKKYDREFPEVQPEVGMIKEGEAFRGTAIERVIGYGGPTQEGTTSRRKARNK